MKLNATFTALGVASWGLFLFQQNPGINVQRIGLVTPEQAEILSHMSIVYLDDGQGGQAKTIRIEGVNVQVVNGLGATETVNGLGNLVVGYNEPGNTSGDDRTGSHNIVGGAKSSYSSWGGIVGGEACSVSGEYAVVVGGLANRATGHYAVVGGGQANVASGYKSWVGGGFTNQASNTTASVSGGQFNQASGALSTVFGGQGNTAEGTIAAVGGGRSNTATAFYSAIFGGRDNVAQQEASTVAGGCAFTTSEVCQHLP